MGLFKRIKAADNGWLTFKDLVGGDTHAGVSVTQESSVNLPAVYRCVSLNAETVASLPVDCLVKRDGKRKPFPDPQWVQKPNDFQDWGQFISQAQVSLELDGNAFILKISDNRGRLAGLYVLNPTAVTVEKQDGVVYYRVNTDNGSQPYAPTAMVHLRGITLPGAYRGLSPVAAAHQTIGMGLAAERFGAQWFGSGATMSGVITTPNQLDPKTTEELRKQFQRKHGGVSKSHAIGVLSGGAQWVPLSVNAEESQFLETRRYTDIQIATLFGVPPEYVTDAEGAKGYVTGLYARQAMWLQTGINPRLLRIERALTELLPGEAYLRFNRNAFLSMSPAERSEFYSSGLQGRWLVPNEVRELEDRDALTGGDEPLWSVQYQGAGYDPPGGQV